MTAKIVGNIGKDGGKRFIVKVTEVPQIRTQLSTVDAEHNIAARLAGFDGMFALDIRFENTQMVVILFTDVKNQTIPVLIAVAREKSEPVSFSLVVNMLKIVNICGIDSSGARLGAVDSSPSALVCSIFQNEKFTTSGA